MKPFALTTIPLLLAACVADDPAIDDGWTEESKADEATTAGVTPTYAQDVMLLDGFHKLLDATTGQCLEASSSTPYSVGAIEKPFDLHFVSSKQDLANTLGIDVGVKIKYGPASIGPSVAFLDTFQQTKSSIHLLVAARASYRVTNLRQVKLTVDAQEWLANDPRAFLHRCGNFFVNGTQYEAQLFVMIRIDALSEDATRSINADLGIGAATAAIGIDANVKAKIERIAKRNDVAIATHVLDRGFLVDGGTGALIAQLLGGGVSAETFTKIDEIRSSMLTSISNDACRDGGMAIDGCTGATPGYFENTTRHALPVKLDLRAYSRATNAPLGGPGSPYEAMRQTVDRANAYLRGLSSVATRMDNIAKGEVAAFLDASSARKALYGIAPPAAPVFAPGNLVSIATANCDRFDVKRPGSVAANVDAAIASCWNAAIEGAPETCATPDGKAVATLPAVVAADAAIANYVVTGRIVPVRFAQKGVLGYNGAKDACAASAMRLPTFVEAQRLAMPIGYGAFARTSEDRLRYAAWHANTSMCTNGELSAFFNIPGGANGNICTQEGPWAPHPTLTVCVPPAGPFADLAAP